MAAVQAAARWWPRRFVLCSNVVHFCLQPSGGNVGYITGDGLYAATQQSSPYILPDPTYWSPHSLTDIVSIGRVGDVEYMAVK